MTRFWERSVGGTHAAPFETMSHSLRTSSKSTLPFDECLMQAIKNLNWDSVSIVEGMLMDRKEEMRGKCRD